MDFFAAQERAHARTRGLVIYFILGVTGLIISLYLVVLVVLGIASNRNAGRFSRSETSSVTSNVSGGLWQPGVFILVTIGTLAVVGGACASKVVSLHGGGGAGVARSVGGNPISPQTTDLGERRLRNIIEEMALASGVPVPGVFVMEEEGINAFAAGFRPEDATITVTRGALRYLTRDELQGVIGHEFSHILNGDMKLNVELIGAVFGLMVLAIIGREILSTLRYAGGSRSGKGDSRGAILIFALALIVLGGLGVFFGRLIQSAISRQRERLADASSVQFTRNPEGLSGALKKIGGYGVGSTINHAHVQETAHMYFAPALDGFFATHPPLEERIRDLDPNWDGKFPRLPERDLAADNAAAAKEAASFSAAKQAQQSAPPAAMVGALLSAAAGAHASLIAVQSWRENLPATLQQALNDAAGCRALALALTLDSDPVQQAAQLQFLRGGQEPAAAAGANLATAVAATPEGSRLPLLELAVAGLGGASQAERDSLYGRLRGLVEFDHQVTLYEFALLRVADYRLHPRPPRLGPAEPEAYVTAVNTVLSALAHAGANEETAAQAAFNLGLSALPSLAGKLVLESDDTLSLDRYGAACDSLEGAPFWFKKQLLLAGTNVIQQDGIVQPAEAELLRALAASLGCPLPPV